MAIPVNQIDHYNSFAQTFENHILNSENPEIWTTDTDPESSMNVQMRLRLSDQEKCISKFFEKDLPVLDMGCGYGRQSLMMSRVGYKVTGIDSSDELINVGNKLAKRYGYQLSFVCDSILDYNRPEKYSQVTLFDVVEHFQLYQRSEFMKTLAQNVCKEKGIVVITIPYMSVFSPVDMLKNIFKFFTSPISSISGQKEHPYPIPFFQMFQSLCSPYFKMLESYKSGDTAYFILQKV